MRSLLYFRMLPELALSNIEKIIFWIFLPLILFYWTGVLFFDQPENSDIWVLMGFVGGHLYFSIVDNNSQVNFIIHRNGDLALPFPKLKYNFLRIFYKQKIADQIILHFDEDFRESAVHYGDIIAEFFVIYEIIKPIVERGIKFYQKITFILEILRRLI